MTITIKDFKDALREHKSICIHYDFGNNYNKPVHRFDMDKDGNIREVFTWDKSSLCFAHIDNDKMIAELLPLDGVAKIEPTPEDRIKEYNCL